MGKNKIITSLHTSFKASYNSKDKIYNNTPYNSLIHLSIIKSHINHFLMSPRIILLPFPVIIIIIIRFLLIFSLIFSLFPLIIIFPFCHRICLFFAISIFFICLFYDLTQFDICLFEDLHLLFFCCEGFHHVFVVFLQLFVLVGLFCNLLLHFWILFHIELIA